MEDADPTLLDSITDIAARDAGRVAVSGSHGGLYPASVASRGGLRAVIFNDAGSAKTGPAWPGSRRWEASAWRPPRPTR
jgi:predicted esterase YcpF (UPF0227 family)